MLSLILALPALIAPSGLSDADIAALVQQSLTSDTRASTSADALGRAGNRRPDTDVARDVLTLLRQRLGTRLGGLTVNCVQGVVSLRGRAADNASRDQALALTRAVSGARSVQNKLTVEGEEPSATAKRSAPPVDEAPSQPFDFLTRDGLAGGDMWVYVTDGVVELRGRASSAAARDYATAAARTVPGARLIKNQMEVRKRSPAEDARLQQLISRLFDWNGFAKTDRERIRVSVRDGVVRLEGPSLPTERAQLAARLARATNGVIVVDDRLPRG